MIWRLILHYWAVHSCYCLLLMKSLYYELLNVTFGVWINAYIPVCVNLLIRQYACIRSYFVLIVILMYIMNLALLVIDVFVPIFMGLNLLKVTSFSFKLIVPTLSTALCVCYNTMTCFLCVYLYYKMLCVKFWLLKCLSAFPDQFANMFVQTQWLNFNFAV